MRLMKPLLSWPDWRGAFSLDCDPGLDAVLGFLARRPGERTYSMSTDVAGGLRLWCICF